MELMSGFAGLGERFESELVSDYTGIRNGGAKSTKQFIFSAEVQKPDATL